MWKKIMKKKVDILRGGRDTASKHYQTIAWNKVPNRGFTWVLAPLHTCADPSLAEASLHVAVRRLTHHSVTAERRPSAIPLRNIRRGQVLYLYYIGKLKFYKKSQTPLFFKLNLGTYCKLSTKLQLFQAI